MGINTIGTVRTPDRLRVRVWILEGFVGCAGDDEATHDNLVWFPLAELWARINAPPEPGLRLFARSHLVVHLRTRGFGPPPAIARPTKHIMSS
jgi:hypothetical protein